MNPVFPSRWITAMAIGLVLALGAACKTDPIEPEATYRVFYDALGRAEDPVDTTRYETGTLITLPGIDTATIISPSDLFQGWELAGSGLTYSSGSQFLIGKSDAYFSAIWDQGQPVIDCESEDTVLSNPNGRIFFLDAVKGNDTNSGLSPAQAWRSLAQASNQPYNPGDWIMLRGCQEFTGGLRLEGVNGSVAAPIRIGTWGANPQENRAIINCRSVENGIYLSACSHIEIKNIEIHGDGGTSNSAQRTGVRVELWWDGATKRHFHFQNLYLHDLFAPVTRPTDGKKNNVNEGGGIAFITLNRGNSHFEDIDIRDCHFENLGTSGITIGKWASEANISAGVTWHQDVNIVDNYFNRLGADGIVTAGVENAYIARNTVLNPGCFDDVRMNGRGDGLWTWFTINCIVEHNYLRGARGRIDCNGMHVDIGSRNNIFQYNLSIDNAGGFCSIIGDTYNSVYRYNVSINDGWRERGTNEYGRNIVDGMAISLSGYNGDRFGSFDVRRGPFNSYIYNNTIYTRSDIVARFKVDHSAQGALIANNLFYHEGTAEDISDDWLKTTEDHAHIICQNNRTIIGGASLPDQVNQSINDNWAWDVFLDNFAIDPNCVNPGGLEALDYLPQNQPVISDQGLDLFLVPGDPDGVWQGFVPASGDYRGTPIMGKPDIGAFEL